MAGVDSGIQAELESYLKEKNINALFVKLVEHLLLNKPSEPIGFIVKYLKENYPEECKEVKLESGPTLGGAAGSVDLMMGGGKKDEDDEESEEEEDDEDEDTSLPTIAASKTKATGRRISVSAESVDPEKMKEKFEKKVIPKSAAEIQMLTDLLAKQVLFSHLDDKQTQIIVDAMFKVVNVKGDDVITQGATGDNFYLIADGSCEVFINQPDGSQLSVLKYGVGDSFGELALLYNSPRAATVRVVSADCTLWGVDRMTFKYILMTSTMAKREKYRGFIDKVMILSCLEEKEQQTIIDALIPKQFKDGEVIITEGASGDVFYIVEEGEVICTQQKTPGSAPTEVCRLGMGNYFGEIALLTDRPRQATVTAAGKVKCLALDRKTFKRVMGPLIDLLKRNLSLYNNYMAGKI